MKEKTTPINEKEALTVFDQPLPRREFKQILKHASIIRNPCVKYAGKPL